MVNIFSFRLHLDLPTVLSPGFFSDSVSHIPMGWDISVGIATRYGLDGPRIESRCGRDFRNPSWTPPETDPASYAMGIWPFLGVTLPRRGVGHPPSSRAEVKERVQLYYSPSGLSRPVLEHLTIKKVTARYQQQIFQPTRKAIFLLCPVLNI